MRWLASAALLLGCTYSDGQPWGRLEAALQVELVDVEGRLTAAGDLRTAKDYAVRVEEMSVVYDALVVQLRGAEAAAFDPADPPEGCTFCHSGHCHCGDDLVDYEDLAVQTGGGGAQLAVSAGSAALTLDAPAKVGLEDCGDCQLPRGDLNAAALTLTQLTARLTVRDLRSPPRMAPQTFDVALTPVLTTSAQLSGGLDRDSSPGVALDATHAISVRLFDAVDWATEAPEAALTERLEAASELRVRVERFAL